jgi:hypothetical protein
MTHIIRGIVRSATIAVLVPLLGTPLPEPTRAIESDTAAVAQVTPAPAQFVCPMHPDIRAGAPGTCSRCGMALVPAPPGAPRAYLLDVETSPRALKSGKRGTLKLRVRDPISGNVVQRFTEVHEKLFHLFVVSHDLTYFDHIHPTLTPEGTLDIDVELPRDGGYQLYADFLPDGATPQLLQRALFTAGFSKDPEQGRARLTADTSAKTSGRVHVALELSQGDGLMAGRPEMFRLRVSDPVSSHPVTDLEPFLGAPAHGLIISEDLRDALHIHPVAEFSKPTGPDIVFQTIFPHPGLYKVWTQFQRGGEVAVVSFVVPVGERR